MVVFSCFYPIPLFYHYTNKLPVENDVKDHQIALGKSDFIDGMRLKATFSMLFRRFASKIPIPGF